MALNPPVSDVDPCAVLGQAGWPEPAAITRVEGGWATFIWRFATSDGRYHALRLYPPGGTTLEQARREELALRATAAAGMPVPELRAAGTFQGQPYFIIGWLPGVPLLTVLERRVWRLWRLGSEFGRLQARLHRLDPKELRVGTSGWAIIEGEADLSEAVARNARNDALCHFDYHPINVLAKGSVITGLVDFSSCQVGDRRADLGRTMALLAAAPIPPSPLKPLLELFRRQFTSAWRRGYRAEAGDFPLEPLYEAWGAATFVRDIEGAVAEGRGWGTPGDIARIKAYLEDRRRAAAASGFKPA